MLYRRRRYLMRREDTQGMLGTRGMMAGQRMDMGDMMADQSLGTLGMLGNQDRLFAGMMVGQSLGMLGTLGNQGR